MKNKLKRGKLCMNNTKVIANSINHHDYRLDNDYINQNEDDTIRSVNFFSKLFMCISGNTVKNVPYSSVFSTVINHMAATKTGHLRTKVTKAVWTR